jgi:hypothetical protein
VNHLDRTGPVRVSFDNQPNDGAPGEDDNVIGVERVRGGGGAGGDRLTGDAGPNALTALGGDDVLEGGLGEDDMLGGSGDDLILANDGVADRVRCDTGTDRAEIDLKDVLLTNTGANGACETIERAAVDQHPNVRVASRRARVGAGGRVRLRLACPRQWRPGCRGTLRLETTRGGRSRSGAMPSGAVVPASSTWSSAPAHGASWPAGGRSSPGRGLGSATETASRRSPCSE